MIWLSDDIREARLRLNRALEEMERASNEHETLKKIRKEPGLMF